eukprot:GHVN01097425.1.p1 GENE.GHVN01097425.1~~GHVN01097425.1.p1  ORF type:complete len:251 (+),score=14.86 GHVN01097425.1:56-808(+)
MFQYQLRSCLAGRSSIKTIATKSSSFAYGQAGRYITTLPNGSVPLFINNNFVESKCDIIKNGFPVHNPANQELLASTPQATHDEHQQAVRSCHEAFLSWKDTPISTRIRYMLKLQHLIRDQTGKLAEILSYEQGKTIADAKGDVFRGLEVVEHSCSGSTILMGETMDNVATGVDTYSYRSPLGVCAGIAPFNFPAMIPLWMFPVATVAGNTFLLKPSERVPLTTMKLMEMIQEIELPPGVVNVIVSGGWT